MLGNWDVETELKIGVSGVVGWSVLSGQRKVEHAIRHLIVEITRFQQSN